MIIVALGAGFNFAMGLVLSLAPELLQGIEQPTVASGAPTKLILISGVACIAFGFVCVWVVREIINKSSLVLVLVYTLSGINVIFGFFRFPLGLLTILINLLLIFLIRSNSAKQWLDSTE